MVDLIANFVERETEIGGLIRERAEGYYNSKCFKTLTRRIDDLQACNDLKPAALKRNDWNSHVVFPIVKERALLRRAITASNYRAIDTFSLIPQGNTPAENAALAETVLNVNMGSTLFRMKCLKPLIDTASKFGSGVTYTYWRSSESSRLETVYDPETQTYNRVRNADLHKNAVTSQVGLRDYFQNPDVADPDSSDFQGHYRRMHISELTPLLENEAYIRVNLQKVIEDLKHGVCKTQQRPWVDGDMNRWGTDVLRYEGVLPIRGNEDSEARYFVEMIGETIIRMSVDDYDDDIRSYTVSSFDKRAEYWWGNSDSEYVVAHENFLNTMLSMTADNAIRSMRQYVFYAKGTIKPSDIANSARTDGFIPVDAGNLSMNQLVNPFQPGAMQLGPTQFISQMVNDSIQKMSTKVDLSRQTSQGGGVLNNTTATGANILAGQADTLEADILENFDFGITEIGRKSLIMLQQFLSEIFYVRPGPKDVERMLEKFQILGRYQVSIHTTAMKNKQSELLRMQNLATWLLNVTANPAMAQAGINILPLVNDILKKADIPSGDEILPKESEVMTPGMVPSAQAPVSATGGGMVPMGAPQPQTMGA